MRIGKVRTTVTTPSQTTVIPRVIIYQYPFFFLLKQAYKLVTMTTREQYGEWFSHVLC